MKMNKKLKAPPRKPLTLDYLATLSLSLSLFLYIYNIPWAPQTYIFQNIMVFRWPKPLFLYGFGGSNIYIYIYWVDLSMCAFLSPPTFEHCQSSLSNNALSGCSFSNHHCQTMPFQGVLSPTIIVKQCPFRVFFLQSSLSNNDLSGCSFSFCISVPTYF